MKPSIRIDPITIDPIASFSSSTIESSILRLDKLHPIVSGNKWFKLRYYIEDAIANKASTIVSFGGPYSNHLVALAFAAKENNLKSIGYVRATKEDLITPSLEEALAYGMQLEFMGRTNFQAIKNDLLKANKNIDNNNNNEGINDGFTIEQGVYYIDEGGYGELGAKGAATILNEHCKNFTTIIAAVGTGTMLTGLIQAAAPHQNVIGIPILKNEASIETEIKTLLKDSTKPFTLLHSFHQGGYAKTNPALFAFMNQLWETEKIPSDIVYTGKLLMAIDSLLKENYFKAGTKLLVIHSGGLQGNRSLPSGTLLY
ncbi:MAG: pyridoxal-phosphate dependent enzyme [Chitinophagaceae bacterium]|nr:pyridoxal-phosphate dependent enzyme [Chitinophagaceae bacterium]